jgi:hypothetical protein
MPKYIIHFGVIVDKIVFLISFSGSSLLMYRNTDFMSVYVCVCVCIHWFIF